MTTYQAQTYPIDDCWNRVGVAGDQSCEKLVIHIRCRNCEVYASAAQCNLQRPVDAGYKKEWASHFRQVQSAAKQSDASSLVFRIGCEWLALPTRIIVAVAPQATPHALPHRSGSGRSLLGIVNVKGKLHPCISLATLLGVNEQGSLPDQGRHAFARLLLMQWEQQVFALPVADLHGIVRYASSTLLSPATTINQGLSPFLAGVITHQDMQIGCLDAALIGQQLARTLR